MRKPNGLFNFLPISVYIGDIGFRMSGNAVEITKLAIGDTNIGGVHITVNLPGHFTMWNLNFSEFVGHIHQISQRRLLE